MTLLWSLVLLFLPLFSCALTSFPSPSTLSTALSSTKIDQRSDSLQSIAKSIVSLYSAKDAFNLWDTSKSHGTNIELEKQPTFFEIGCPTLFFGQALQAAGIRRANINAGSTQFCSQFISDESFHGFPKSDIVLATSLLWHDISYLTHQWVVRTLVKHAPSLVIFGTGIDHVALSQYILSKEHSNINDYGTEAWNIEGWIERFAAFGYALDTLSTAVLRQHISCTKFDDPALASIFHSSILVFRITSAHPSIKTHDERITNIAPHILHTLSSRDQYRMIIESIHAKTCRSSVIKQRSKFESQVDRDKSLDVEMRGEIVSLAMNLWQQQQQWNRIWTSIQQDALTHMLRTSDMTTSRAPISSISASLVHPYTSFLPGFSMSIHDTRLSPLPDPRELLTLFEVKPNEKAPRWSQWSSEEQRSLFISLFQSRRFATLTLLLTSTCSYYIKLVDMTTKFDTIPLLDDANDVTHHEINNFIDMYYSLLLRPDMILSYDEAVELIYNIPAITRLVRISDVDLDQYFENVEPKHIPIRNILATYIPNLSPTQHEWINIREMISRDSQLTSLWFIMIMSQTSDGVHIDTHVSTFITRAVEQLPHDIYVQEWLYETHWGSVAVKGHTEMAAYVSEAVSTLFPTTSLESTYKNITNTIYGKHLSQEIQPWNKTFPVSALSPRNLPRIAIMVPHFTISSASIRRSFPILTHLRTLFDITLILYTPDAISNDRIKQNQIWAFREWGDVTIHNILKLEDNTTPPRINWIVKQNFAAIIYIDLSHRLCALLASHRLARIQIALGYPSPQSSYGTLIDYWIGGGDVEKIDQDDTVEVKMEGKMVTRLKSYWETLVLVPGTGILLSPPTHFPRDLLSIRVSARPHDTPDKPFILNCPWSLSSFDLHHISRLISIRDSVSRPIKFRFFIGERDGKRLSILRILREKLGTKYVELIPIADGIEFTRYLSQGHLMLDSYPHGSLMNLVTTLCTRVGVVSLEGDQWSNRIGPAILRKMDLESLVATSPDDFVSRVVNLINDADTYNNMMSNLLKTNLSQRLLIHDEERPLYGTAIKHILKQHDNWKREGKALVKLDRSTLKRLEKTNKDDKDEL